MSDGHMRDESAKTAGAFIEGLTIFSSYWAKGLGQKYMMGGEHDILYIYYTEDIDEDSEDGLRLSTLGFHREDDGWAWFT